MEDKRKKLIMVIISIIIIGIIIIYVIYDNEGNEYIIEEFEEVIANIDVNTVENSDKNTNETVDNEVMIAIHITGAVNRPGLIYLNQGARIDDAIKQAGGATKKANLNKVNLAYVLSDGQKIYIPSNDDKEENIAYIISNSGENIVVEDGSKGLKGVNGKVNINTANQQEIETLPGIGPALAQRILDYRETNGKFKNIEDLQNVKGIGDSKYNNIKDKICINWWRDNIKLIIVYL